jgi:hypothetical protein
MKSIPPLVIAAGLFAFVLGLAFGLYALLTRGQRRTMREIRAGASERGWRYRLRRWESNPTAFRIDGRTRAGLSWILTSGNTRGYDRGWVVGLNLRFPTLGGDADLAVRPRDDKGKGAAPLGPGMPPGLESRVAAWSGTLASIIGLYRDAQEVPSGLPAFDAAYQVLVLPRQFRRPPLDPGLAERFLHWPPDAIAPHSVRAWRDPFGFKLQARLPATPNWATVSYFLTLAEDFCSRLPAPITSPAPRGFVDRIVARIWRS